MMKTRVIRAFRSGDEAGIFELWKKVYSNRQLDKDKWLSWWRWMYEENPSGEGIIRLAEDSGKLVGQYAIVPVQVKFGDNILIGAQSLDTMTHPDYRRQGIFENLANAVYKEASDRGISIIYGFPNQFSYPGFVKNLGWFDISRMQVIMKPFNWRNTLRPKIRNEFLLKTLVLGTSLIFNKLFLKTQKPPNIEGLTLARITSFDERFDEFWPRISDQSKIMVVRDRNYLNWRYSTPGSNYSIFAAEKGFKVLGYIVLQHKAQFGTKTSSIFDLMAQSEDVMHCLISRAIEESQKESDVLYYSSITNNIYSRIFRKNGFIPLIFIKSGHFCAYSQITSSSQKLLINPKNWIVQTGDSDAT